MKTPSKVAFEAILIAAVIFALVAIPRAASAASQGAHQPPPFSEFDGDGDGFVSEDEFNSTRAEHMAARAAEGKPMHGAASAPVFDDMDTDGDGKLNEEELTAGQKAHMAAMRESKGTCGGKGKGKHKGKGSGMAQFADIDTNGDGCIDADEFSAHHAGKHGKRHGAMSH